MRRGTLTTTQRTQDAAEVRQSLVQQIANLDDRRAVGQISEADWLRQRSELKAQLMEVVAPEQPHPQRMNMHAGLVT